MCFGPKSGVFFNDISGQLVTASTEVDEPVFHIVEVFCAFIRTIEKYLADLLHSNTCFARLLVNSKGEGVVDMEAANWRCG